MSWQTVLDFLDRRSGLLDGVVFSGGEPTVDRYLGDAITQVRDRGFKVGLHTAGIYPERLRKLLPKIDWVGFDVKAPFAEYAITTGVRASGEQARQSFRHLLASGAEFEIRVTYHPDLLAPEVLKSMAIALRNHGAENFALQEFRPDGCSDLLLDARPIQLHHRATDHLQALFPNFTLRRAS